MTKSNPADLAFLEEFGHRLARRRIDAGLTQAELAHEAGVGRSTVERLEAGESANLTSLIRILRVLGLLQPVLGAIPDPDLRPMDLLARRDRRRRVGRGRKPDPVREWAWDEDK